MKTIIVTGAHGFVGSAVVKDLVASGHKVISVVRKGNCDIDDTIVWDIRTPYKGRNIKADIIIHAAAKVDDWADAKESHAVNVVGTQHVCTAFSGVQQIIYISSASVYDPTNSDSIITEVSPAGTNLLNSYSETKYLGERVVEDSDIPGRIILRPHIIYGPGDKTILPRLLKARKFGRFLVLGNANNTVSLTHIDNLVHAIRTIVSRESATGFDIFNIADAKSGKIKDILKNLKHVLNIKEDNLHIPKSLATFLGLFLEKSYKLLHIHHAPLITPYIVEQMTASHTIDCAKAVAHFGYKPAVTYEIGFMNL